MRRLNAHCTQVRVAVFWYSTHITFSLDHLCCGHSNGMYPVPSPVGPGKIAINDHHLTTPPTHIPLHSTFPDLM